MERSFEECERRYHKITAHPARLQDLYVDLFVARYDTPPQRIVLDIDATDIKNHGQQVGGFFHGYYERRCFLPLYIQNAKKGSSYNERNFETSTTVPAD